MIDERELMILAYKTAASSPDPSNQNGAALVSRYGEPIKRGYNGLTLGVSLDLNKVSREEKLRYVIHAEQRVCLGVDARSAIMICPWAACSMCAKCIVESGVSVLVRHKERMALTPERWKYETQIGDDIMRKAGIEIKELEGPLHLEFPILVNGEPWSC